MATGFFLRRFLHGSFLCWADPLESIIDKDLSTVDGELAMALLHVSEQIISKRERITDYTVEFLAPSGAEHAVIIFGDLFSYGL